MGTALSGEVSPNRSVGRPREYDRDTIMQTVSERIASGELVTDIANELGIPDRRVREWALLPEYAPLYERARISQAHAMAENTLLVARSATNDDWQAKKLEVDTLKWLTSKIAPKLYGERIEHNVEGTVEHAVTFKVENRKVTAG